ncbi:MAG: D-2-hydroxyacid dehydrogenase [Oscillospiraceae bacterium]|nr:D-2-hydroxyacid dehydrogenase [Oscillospiraceae bacterium]
MAKIVVLNGQRINYDGQIDYSVLGDDVTVYEDSRPDEILPRLEGAEILVTKELVLTPEQVSAMPECVRLICEAGTGYNNIPLEAAKANHIMVCNIPSYSSHRVAHTAIMLLLALSSNMQKQQAMLVRGDHSNFTKALQVGHTEVNGKILGIVGAGAIGSKVIEIALALEMEVLVYTRTPRPNREHVHSCSLDEVLQRADYLSLHCPLNDQTRHLIDAAALQKMKPTACLINTSRGGLVDEAALITALEEKQIAAAGLDVQEVEPPAPDSKLYTLDNVILTPHMGWKGFETRQRLVSMLAENIRAYLDGTPINRVV